MNIIQQILDFISGNGATIIANALIIFWGILKFVKVFAPLTKWTWDDDLADKLQKIGDVLIKLFPDKGEEVAGELKKPAPKKTFLKRLIDAA